MDIRTYAILLITFLSYSDGQRARYRPNTRSRAQAPSRPRPQSRPQSRPQPRPRGSSPVKCFARNLQHGRSFYHVMDEPIGRTTNVLRGSGRTYVGKMNRDITFTVFGPSPYDGVRFKGFVVTRLCLFTKNVESVRMAVQGIPTKRRNGYTPAATAYVQARVHRSNKWEKSCLTPYKTPLNRVSVVLRRRKGKPSRVLAQKLYMEACERR